jgi:hypothetical protein
MHTALHALDAHLVHFLEQFVVDEPNTVLVLLGDHGLQDGPGAMDWASQVGHRNPFLTILAPASVHANATALKANAGRLVTVHDLYKTLATVLHPPDRAVELHPPWGVDLLHDVVPIHRSCRDVHVPPDFCSCQHEFTWAAGDMAALRCSPHEPHPEGICNPVAPTLTKRQACCQEQLRPP